jgi:hypothetical protein
VGPGDGVEGDLELGPVGVREPGRCVDLRLLEFAPRSAAAPPADPDVDRVGAGVECRRHRRRTATGCEEKGH